MNTREIVLARATGRIQERMAMTTRVAIAEHALELVKRFGGARYITREWTFVTSNVDGDIVGLDLPSARYTADPEFWAYLRELDEAEALGLVGVAYRDDWRWIHRLTHGDPYPNVERALVLKGHLADPRRELT